MTPPSWAQVKSVFERLRATPRTQRQAVLLDDIEVGANGFGGLNEAQLAELHGLLACADEMGSFLERAWTTTTTDPWPAGHCVNSRYRILRHIGRGGMGDVYEADDLELRTRVALKRLRADAVDDRDAALAAVERLRREVDLARRVSHPNVCRIFDIGRDPADADADGTLFISMELLAGETLEARIARDGALPEAEAFAIASQICAGLDAAHAAGVIHRDLKTANVMLVPASDSMRVVITDFGLACRTSGESSVTRIGDVFGTPHYMAPELVAGGRVGPAADIFALGVVLYRLISARYPFDAASAWHVMVRRLTDAPTPLRDACPSVSPRWEQAIARCLARDPRQRPAHAREVMRLLEGGVVARTMNRRLAAVTVMLALCTWPDGRAHLATEPLSSTRGGAVLPFTPIAPGAAEFYAQGKGYLLRSGEHDIDAAIDLLRRAVDAQPTFALAQAALARAYAKRYQRAHDADSADRAQQAAAEALRLDPSLSSAYAARGMVLRQAGRRDEAVQAFQVALQHDGQDVDVLNQLANTYDELGDALRAETTFQRAIRINPGYWVGYNNLGRFYLQHRQFEEAKQQFRWATELAPDNPRAQSNLGGLYLTLGDFVDAKKALQRAYELQPTAANCSNLGTTSLALGETPHAVAMFEQAVKLAPHDHRYRRNLGDVYEIAGRHADALAAWTQAASIIESTALSPSASASASPSADQFATAALYRAKLHEAAATRRWLADAVRVLHPDDAGAQLKIAQAQELIGDRDAALATLTRATTAGLARAEIDQSAELARLRRDPRYARLAPPPAAP